MKTENDYEIVTNKIATEWVYRIDKYKKNYVTNAYVWCLFNNYFSSDFIYENLLLIENAGS